MNDDNIMLVLLFLVIVCFFCGISGKTATVTEASPCKVLVVTNDDGTTTIVRPQQEDYAFCLATQKEAAKTIPVKQRLFGKKCTKKG